VALHDGRVEARSEGLGRGSEFVVNLPRVVGRAIDSPAAQPPLQPFPRRRVLVVDDNRDAGEMLGELPTALGAIVTVVDSGRAALAALDSFEPEAILLDIGMPGMDGYEVARRIRASAGHHDVLLIALTGWGQEADRRRTVAAGFDHHVIKPPDVERLRQLLLASPPGTVGVRSRPQ
jgi:CheY-like chemotaxis protein